MPATRHRQLHRQRRARRSARWPATAAARPPSTSAPFAADHHQARPAPAARRRARSGSAAPRATACSARRTRWRSRPCRSARRPRAGSARATAMNRPNRRASPPRSAPIGIASASAARRGGRRTGAAGRASPAMRSDLADRRPRPGSSSARAPGRSACARCPAAMTVLAGVVLERTLEDDVVALHHLRLDRRRPLLAPRRTPRLP